MDIKVVIAQLIVVVMLVAQLTVAGIIREFEE